MGDRECQMCGSALIFGHNAPHLGVFAALCTACLLRHKAGSFCRVCFDTYDDSSRPAAHSRIMCFRCPALTHLTAFPPPALPPPSATYVPSDPSFSFIDSGPAAAADGTSAVVLTKAFSKHLCAAKIAAAAMHRAAAVARADAEQKVMGAVLARRNAKEAIERVAYLMSNQQAQDRSDADDG